MKYRELGRTGWRVSTISFGTWAIGNDWGRVEAKDSLAALNRAVLNEARSISLNAEEMK